MSTSTYFVAPWGKDSNSGSIDSPFRSIRRATNAVGNNGGKILLRGGVYSPTEPTWISPSARNPGLTISAYADEKPVIDAGNLQSGEIPITVRDAHNLTISGLRIRNSKNHGIEVINGTNIKLTDNIIHDVRGMGIRVRGHLAEIPGEGDSNVKSENIQILRNTVYSTNLANSGSAKGTQNWGSAIQVMNATNVRVNGNSVFGNYGEGIALTLVDGGVAQNNTLRDNFSIQLYLDNVSNTKIKGNFIHETGNRNFFRDGMPSSGIGLANELHRLSPGDSPSRYYLNNLEIVNNVIVAGGHALLYGTWAGIHSGISNNDQGLSNTVIAHNTIYYPRFESLKFEDQSSVRQVDVANNIVVKGNRGPLVEAPNQGINFFSNLWSGGETGDESSPDDLRLDPRFVNAGGGQYSDYRLTAASPAVDRAVRIPGINDTRRKPDLGAIESHQRDADDGTPSGTISRINGTQRSDLITGTANRDLIFGGSGNDTLRGAAGNDRLKGQEGSDTLNGGVGDDALHGGVGNDLLYGRDGRDRLIGVDLGARVAGLSERDTLVGGSGKDTYVLGNRKQVFYNDGQSDTQGLRDYALIQKFDVKESDRIQLSGSESEYRILSSSPSNLPKGKAIYWLGNGTRELIAIVQTQDALDLSSASFKFI